jgi:tetratricopeptide (TPR) repeat protein
MITLYEQKNNYAKAAEYGEKALKITEEALGPDDLNVASILIKLGRVYTNLQRYAESKKTLKRALLIFETKYGKDHPFTGKLSWGRMVNGGVW